MAVRAFRGLFENVICNAGIRVGNAVENPIERDLRIRVAVLASFNHAFGFAKLAASRRMTFCCSAVGSKKSADIYTAAV